MSAIMHTKSTNSKSSCILHMKISNILKYTNYLLYTQTLSIVLVQPANLQRIMPYKRNGFGYISIY